MVKKMNKKEFISELAKTLSYSVDDCATINDILEKNFFISKKNKDKIIDDFMKTLNVECEEALNIYDVAIKIISEEVKNKFKHPFRSKD